MWPKLVSKWGQPLLIDWDKKYWTWVCKWYVHFMKNCCDFSVENPLFWCVEVLYTFVSSRFFSLEFMRFKALFLIWFNGFGWWQKMRIYSSVSPVLPFCRLYSTSVSCLGDYKSWSWSTRRLWWATSMFAKAFQKSVFCIGNKRCSKWWQEEHLTLTDEKARDWMPRRGVMYTYSLSRSISKHLLALFLPMQITVLERQQ